MADDRSRGELEFDSAGGRGPDTAGAHHAVREAELRADVERLKLTGDWAILLWGLTVVMDILVPIKRGVSPAGVLATWAAGMVVLLSLRGIIHRPAVTHTQLARVRAIVFGAFTILIALQAAQDRGMGSPILLGLACCALTYAMTSPLPLRATGVRLFGLALLGLATNAAVSPRAGLAVFAGNAATILACVVLLAIGADAYWRLRRQVFARRLVGRYRLVERIGKGGMGEVWRATHPGLRRDVAIKILRSDRATPEQIARFEAEIAALSELSHPNIVRVYDSGVTDDGLCYFAMELLRGETLAARVRRAGPLDAETATSVMRQVGRALAEAHAHGIVHRDLTPDNVFLDPSAGTEHAKLIDFGIAALTTETGAVVAGTPAYMAPEQARGEAATPAADLYALGAVWYFALTGRAPFAHADANAAIVAHASAEIVAPSVHAAAIPPRVDAIVTRCLAKDPAARFANARTLEEAIGGAAVPLSQIAIALDPLAQQADAPEPTPTPVEDPELRASYVRCTTVLRWVLALWLALGALDLAPSLDLSYFLGVRAAVAAIVLACVLYLRRGLPTPRALAAVRTAAFVTLTIGVALVALGDTGVQSARVGAIMIVLVAQGLAVPARMREGAIRLGATYLLFTATLWLGVAVRTPASIDLEMYVQYAFAIMLTAVLMASVGNAYWSLRQQLFEQRVVGRYRLGRMLGAGGMGQVWTADHPGLGREVAVKLLRPGDASDELVARFETEIHALTELAHPHTVRVYDCGITDDGYWYYVMERLHGTTLTQAVRAGAMSGRRAIRIARQIANALGEAHAAGIVHRDLKPDNLFLTTVGEDRDFVKVLDFGVAKRAVASRLTQTGMAVGTPAFMAPEQALSCDVDGRTDVYALGAVMFHMLAGRPPFIADAIAIVMLAQVHDPAPRVAMFAAGIPEVLDELIDRCLAKDPRDRPASMAELERELAAIERDYEELPLAPAGTVSPVTSADAPTVVARRQ